MLDICLLGTGGMMPLPRRYLTSMMARYNGRNILIDCGEGTQTAIKSKGWNFKPIELICVTHFHADHISGLPGLLLAMANAGRTEELVMIGPKGLAKIVGSLRCIAPELPFSIRFIELNRPEFTFEQNGYRVKAFRLRHNVICYGYCIEIDRKGRFDVEKANSLNLPKPFWGRLQNGETVFYQGVTYTPDSVMGPPRKGLKVVYATDTRPVDAIAEISNEADLLICEGMYGEPEKLDKAKEYKHMTFYEAAELARRANPERLWLTHYSPSLVRPEPYMDRVRAIFPNATAGKDGMSVELSFSDEQ